MAESDTFTHILYNAKRDSPTSPFVNVKGQKQDQKLYLKTEE